jgi:protocatechuate 3,4-dioxygenase, alpha subunit
MMRLLATPSQTVGPFFSIGLDPMKIENLAAPSVAGERVIIAGRVLDGDGIPVPDALLEIWQADAYGKYARPEGKQHAKVENDFMGFGRVSTNDAGEFRFTTIKPGAVPGPKGQLQAPHLAVSVFMRGLLKRLVTRVYFPDEPANANDFILDLVEAPRRHTLIAQRRASTNEFEWNVILQGANETVFFDC